MASLNTALWTAMSALNTSQELINISGNNIANVDNPDYARQQAQVIAQDPIRFGNLNFGTGVRLGGIQGIRDAALNLRIAQESSHQAGTSAFLSAMQQIEPGYASGNANGVDTKLDAFWSAWQKLSSDTSNPSLRQQVISTGQSLATTLQQSSKQVSDLRNSLDQSMQDSVSQVNTLVQTIAKLNASATQSPNDPSIADQQDSAIQKLSGLLDISVIRSGGAVEVTTRAGNSLVTGTHASSLSLNVNGAGGTNDQLLLDGADITSQVSDGAIGGALQARDTALPALQGRLDVLANSITSAVNTAYVGNFFTPLSQVAGSASAISVALTDPTLLQTGASGDPGDNSIVNAVAALATQPVVSGVSASEYQSQTVFQLGNEIANAQADSDASQSIISQMIIQRAAISGVSLDQEAANLMQFERSYQAAARVINTIDQMMQTAIGLGAQ